MKTTVYESGSKLLACIGCTVMLLVIMGGTALTFGFWFWKRAYPVLLLAMAGCSEYRVSAECKTLVYQVSFCSEVVR